MVSYVEMGNKLFSFFPSELVQQDELRLNAFLVLFCLFCFLNNEIVR